MKEIYDKIYDYCRRDQYIRLDDYLSKVGLVDLLYDDGLFFELALRKKTANTLNNLLKYYTETHLCKDINSIDYKLAKYKLLNILQEMKNKVEVSSEVQGALDKYMLNDDDSDSRHDLSEIEEEHTSSHDEGSCESSENSNLTAENLHRLEVAISGDMTAEHEI